MWRLFLGLYFSYLTLGPHWISNLITGTPLRLVDSPTTLAKRSVFVSYVSLLFTAWFLYRPSRLTFAYAAIISMMATMAFYTQYGPENPLPMHLLLNVVILTVGRDYADEQLYIMMLLIIFYPLTRNILYDI
jgi:hypothetical protein